MRASNYELMHSFFTLRRITISGIFFFFLAVGCTRITSTELGAGLIPAVDGVTTLDTLLDVVTDTFDDPDSVRVYKGDNQLLGSIGNDPLFGKTKASLFFELKPNTFPFYISGNKDSIVVDSAVLILSFRSVYGDSMQPMRINVNEINTSTPLDPYVAYAANYPSTMPATIGASLAAPVVVDLRRLADSVNNRYENAKNQIRIRLNNTVARRFLKDYDSTNAYKSDSIFRTYFAGFAVTADANFGTNALVKVNLADTNTKFALYYSSSSTGATQRDTSVVYFKYNSTTGGNANLVLRDRSGSELSKHITTTSKPDSLVYLQTSPGTYVRVRVPGLQNLSNRIIHRAELIVEQVPDDANLLTIDAQMTPPRYLLLSRIDTTNGYKYNIPNDYMLSSSGANTASFGGYLSYKSIQGYDKVAAYTFDLSRYVQGIVTRKDPSYTLRLTAPTNDSLHYIPPYPGNTSTQTYILSPTSGNDLGDGRVRIGGGTHSRFRMRLRVIFSRI